MKNYKTIAKDAEKITNQIKEMEAALDSESANYADDLKKITELRLTRAILKDNLTASLATAGLKALSEVLVKYDGKALGSATTDNINRDLRKCGFSVWFSRNYYLASREKSCDHITITAEISSGTYNYHAEADIYTRNHDYFVNEDNKINLDAFKNATPSQNYTENPRKKAHDLQKLYTKYAGAIAEAGKIQEMINDQLPNGCGWFDNVNKYIYGFKYR